MAYDKTETNWWRDALDGKTPPIHFDTPMRGFYAYRPGRDKELIAVAIWYKDGDLKCTLNKQPVNYGLDVWTGCARHPIEYKVYTDVIEGQPWPNEIRAEMADGSTQSTMTSAAPVGHNSGDASDQFSVLTGNIEEWIRQADKALKGGPPKTKDEADKFADLATKLGDLVKEADAKRIDESKPFHDQWKEINARWNKYINPADPVIKKLKAAIGIFQKAERDRREAAAREAQEKAAEQGVELNIEAGPVRVGTRRAVTTVKRQVVEISDIKKAAAYFLDQETVPPLLVETIEKLAYHILKAGVKVPGAKLETKDVTR